MGLLLVGAFAGLIGGVQVLEGGLGEQGERAGRVGQDPQRGGAPHLQRRVVAALGEDHRDPVQHRDEHRHVAGVRPGHQCLQAVLVDRTRTHEPPQRLRPRTLLGSSRVDLDDLGLDQVEEPLGRQRLDVGRGGSVDPGRLDSIEVRARAAAGDLGGDPGPGLAVLDPLPQPRVPVPHQQRIPDQPLTGLRRHPQQGGQLRSGELVDLRTVLADPDRPRHARQLTGQVVDEVRGVLVRPSRCEQELPRLGRHLQVPRPSQLVRRPRRRPARRSSPTRTYV